MVEPEISNGSLGTWYLPFLEALGSPIGDFQANGVANSSEQ